MANNRMALVCKICVPKEDDWRWGDKGVMAIAKWYPGGPYYRNNNETMGKDFEEFLEEHYHDGESGENPIRLEYESYEARS